MLKVSFLNKLNNEKEEVTILDDYYFNDGLIEYVQDQAITKIVYDYQEVRITRREQATSEIILSLNHDTQCIIKSSYGDIIMDVQTISIKKDKNLLEIEYQLVHNNVAIVHNRILFVNEI